MSILELELSLILRWIDSFDKAHYSLYRRLIIS